MPEEALYVLKLRHDRPEWRVTLEELRSATHWEFASLEACLNFIAGSTRSRWGAQPLERLIR